MSRHELQNGRYRIALGWDNPMQSFFATVTSGPDDYVHLWVGTCRGEVPSIDALAAALSPYHTLTGEMRIRLHQDRLDTLDRGPTQLQHTLLNLVDPSRKHCPEE
ncbi:hypothetical protein [Asticcacaulis sp.]|uniref:hypothetical protein n=1 Tax=Asticcacaulis sp. TaxID=1872648 RepID=UPI00263848D9|nr:hypothetical protein [Asticcacaulis sp.]